MENTNETFKMEFMRRSRFDSIKNQFNEISVDAKKVIDLAKPTDILKLSLTFVGLLKVTEAEIFDEEKFIELAFEYDGTNKGMIRVTNVKEFIRLLHEEFGTSYTEIHLAIDKLAGEKLI